MTSRELCEGVATICLFLFHRYAHKDYVTIHLQFLQFILQEGVLYLPSNRCRELWTALIANRNACDWDRDTAFDWFTKGISDLEQETQAQLFQKEFLKLDPSKLTDKGFTCFKAYFESVNVYEHKLKKSGAIYYVEKLELIGMDFLWETCLNVADVEIADKAMLLLIAMSYSCLSQRFKKASHASSLNPAVAARVRCIILVCTCITLRDC